MGRLLLIAGVAFAGNFAVAGNALSPKVKIPGTNLTLNQIERAILRSRAGILCTGNQPAQGPQFNADGTFSCVEPRIYFEGKWSQINIEGFHNYDGTCSYLVPGSEHKTRETSAELVADFVVELESDGSIGGKRHSNRFSPVMAIKSVSCGKPRPYHEQAPGT